MPEVLLAEVGGGTARRRSVTIAWLGRILFAAVLWGGVVLGVANAQLNYLTQPGYPTFSTSMPVKLGSVDLGNGDLHLTIPIASAPQRGRQTFTASFTYDSVIWHVVNNGSSNVWQPDNVQNGDTRDYWHWNGWRYLASGNGGTTETYDTTTFWCGSKDYWTYSNFGWTDPSGTAHSFPITTTDAPNSGCGTDNPNGDALASDSSGYHLYITDYFIMTMYAPDGTKVFTGLAPNPYPIDANGNYYSGGYPVWEASIDTLHRTPVNITENQSPGPWYFDVLNSQGTTSRITMTTTTINVKTNFGLSGVTECTTNCSLTVVQSIALPDGTSYGFKYDCDSTTSSACGSPTGQSAYYGTLISMTLPTGGQLSYGYTDLTGDFCTR